MDGGEGGEGGEGSEGGGEGGGDGEAFPPTEGGRGAGLPRLGVRPGLGTARLCQEWRAACSAVKKPCWLSLRMLCSMYPHATSSTRPAAATRPHCCLGGVKSERQDARLPRTLRATRRPASG